MPYRHWNVMVKKQKIKLLMIQLKKEQNKFQNQKKKLIMTN